MVVKENIDVNDASLVMLKQEFPEMTDEEASKLVSYALYQNSDKGDIKGVQLNVSANLFPGFNLSTNYAYTYARTKSGSEWTPLERSIRHTATIAANYHHVWGKYGLDVNLNGRLQSKTYYPGYEDAPGYDHPYIQRCQMGASGAIHRYRQYLQPCGSPHRFCDAQVCPLQPRHDAGSRFENQV